MAHIHQAFPSQHEVATPLADITPQQVALAHNIITPPAVPLAHGRPTAVAHFMPSGPQIPIP